MSKKIDIVRISKSMSYLLRHGAEKEGIAIDPEGWVSVQDVLKYADISMDVLLRVVHENNKSRFELKGPKIRAVQGHSVVADRDALENTWLIVTSDEPIYHGTSLEALEGISKTGIQSVARTHVHCTSSVDSRVGKRANVDVLLEISTVMLREKGLVVYQSPNGVILVRDIPLDCIVGVSCQTKRAIEALDGVVEKLGLT